MQLKIFLNIVYVTVFRVERGCGAQVQPECRWPLCLEASCHPDCHVIKNLKQL